MGEVIDHGQDTKAPAVNQRVGDEVEGPALIRTLRRWVVECTLAWLNHNRRLAKDFEATVESAVTWLYIASVKLISRRLAVA